MWFEDLLTRFFLPFVCELVANLFWSALVLFVYLTFRCLSTQILSALWPRELDDYQILVVNLDFEGNFSRHQVQSLKLLLFLDTPLAFFSIIEIFRTLGIYALPAPARCQTRELWRMWEMDGQGHYTYVTGDFRATIRCDFSTFCKFVRLEDFVIACSVVVSHV